VIFIATLASVSAQSKTIDLSSAPDSHSHVIELSPVPDSQTKRMTVDDVIKMSEAGRSDEVIIEQLKKEGQYFNLTSDQLLKLKTAHVSKQVIQVMVDPYPIRDDQPSSSEKPAASKTAALSTDFQYHLQCLQRCNQALERCRANAHDKVPDICMSRTDSCGDFAKVDAEDHQCFVQVGKCNAKCP